MCYSITEVRGLHALGAAVREISGLSDPDFLFSRVCSATAELLGVEACAIGVTEDESVARIADCYGLPSRLRGTRFEIEESHTSSTRIIDGEAGVHKALPPNKIRHRIGNLEHTTGFFSPWPTPDPQLNTFIAQPVRYGGMLIAVLYAGNRTEEPIEPQAASMLHEFAAFAAPLIMGAIRASRIEKLAKDEERQRITQHLHDTSLQLLFSISLSARALGENSDLPPAALRTVRAIAANAAQASLCLRDTFKNNLPEDGGLVVSIRHLAESFASRSSIPTQVTYFGQPRTVPPRVDHGLVCALRETLHNVEKHAMATCVSIGVTFTPTSVVLVVQDDGVGFDQGTPVVDATTSMGHGLGLYHLARDAVSLGGDVTWSKNDDGGTTVRMTVPTEYSTSSTTAS